MCLYNKDYESKTRFISYYNQYKFIRKGKYKNVLEIGTGNGTLKILLEKIGVKIKTADIDTQLKPDIVLDLNKKIELKERFDCIVLFQTLEHIPYNRVRFVLKELFDYTENIIISVPIQLTYFYLGLKLPLTTMRKEFLFGIEKTWNTRFLSREHEWELGTKGYRKNCFVKELGENGIMVVSEFQEKQNPYHLFLELKRGATK